MSGAEIAAEVAQALSEVAVEVGAGAFKCVFRRKVVAGGTDWAPTYTNEDTELDCFRKEKRVRDESGALTGEIDHEYLVPATGFQPKKGDKVFIGYAADEVQAMTDPQRAEARNEVDWIEPVSPAGTPLLYRVRLVR